MTDTPHGPRPDHAPELTGNTKEEVVQWATAWLKAYDIPVGSTAPEPHSPTPQPPSGYAYRYRSGKHIVVRFNNGQEVNGQRPLEAIPYWLGHPPVPSSTAPRPSRRAPDWRENADRVIPWLIEASYQAADSDRPESAGMLHLASELLGEIRQEDEDWAPVQPTSSFDRAPATEDCRDFADQGPCCWAWSDNTRSWVLMGRWGLWGSPNTLWVPWWAIDLPCGWGEWQP